MAERNQCQGCGRWLVPLNDGTSRRHATKRGNGMPCPSSGYRLARWPVGRRLHHHSGDIWEVRADLGGEYGDYLMRCIEGRESGRELRAHGEYMHRHGWTPIHDLMGDLKRSLETAASTPDSTGGAS